MFGFVLSGRDKNDRAPLFNELVNNKYWLLFFDVWKWGKKKPAGRYHHSYDSLLQGVAFAVGWSVLENSWQVFLRTVAASRRALSVCTDFKKIKTLKKKSINIDSFKKMHV